MKILTRPSRDTRFKVCQNPIFTLRWPLHSISHIFGFTLFITICISFLQVIGDKKAAEASAILLQRQGRDSLRKLEDKLGVQLTFIHVIRNPFHNIATMALRTADLKKNKPQDDLKVGIYCIN